MLNYSGLHYFYLFKYKKAFSNYSITVKTLMIKKYVDKKFVKKIKTSLYAEKSIPARMWVAT